MSYRIIIRESLSIIALFMFFLMVLVAIAGLTYFLKELGIPVIRDFFKVSQLNYIVFKAFI
ncbi:MAG: hypothetical protein NZ929_01750 [Aigarchaeota archaeon]|nr:hypothetical protein [Aigarchaeota archaeon]MCX8192953.1 hypothetical protein [Nitrososphaeria archaeon]MDW7986402.1 hypothetical protein [Nitrososphaerota archaeon]